MSKKNVKSEANKKPYCKVCHDAGKVESVYTSHWVKDLTGKTTCPTLLSTECRYCYKLGHTAKFCDVIAKNNKERERSERKSQSAAPKQPAPNKKLQNTALVMGNGFAALCDDSDSEEEVSNTNVINEYPSLQSGARLGCEPAKTIPIREEVKSGWAAIAAKPKESNSAVVNPGVLVLSNLKTPVATSKPVVIPKPAPWVAKDLSKPISQVMTKSWADWSDSEDEEDEIEEKEWKTMSYAQADDDW